MRRVFSAATVLVLISLAPIAAVADGNLHKVNHIIIVMQENHSFDNYFGALAYAPRSPYHNGNGTCSTNDHLCVDGLTCSADSFGNVSCSNSNLDDDGSTVKAFHELSRCVVPDLDHSWVSTHKEANFLNPNSTLSSFLSNGFVRVNDLTEQLTMASKALLTTRPLGFTIRPTFPSTTI